MTVKKIMKKLAIILGILVVLGIFILTLVAVAGGSYNHLVKLSQAADSQWAQVQNDYQRRADLIPNLVSTVAGAANFEKSTLTEITQARASVGQVKIDPNNAPTDPANSVDETKSPAMRTKTGCNDQPDFFRRDALRSSIQRRPQASSAAITAMRENRSARRRRLLTDVSERNSSLTRNIWSAGAAGIDRFRVMSAISRPNGVTAPRPTMLIGTSARSVREFTPISE